MLLSARLAAFDTLGSVSASFMILYSARMPGDDAPREASASPGSRYPWQTLGREGLQLVEGVWRLGSRRSSPLSRPRSLIGSMMCGFMTVVQTQVR